MRRPRRRGAPAAERRSGSCPVGVRRARFLTATARDQDGGSEPGKDPSPATLDDVLRAVGPRLPGRAMGRAGPRRLRPFRLGVPVVPAGRFWAYGARARHVWLLSRRAGEARPADLVAQYGAASAWRTIRRVPPSFDARRALGRGGRPSVRRRDKGRTKGARADTAPNPAQGSTHDRHRDPHPRKPRGVAAMPDLPGASAGSSWTGTARARSPTPARLSRPRPGLVTLG